jgi:hypothetical protein
MLLQLGTHEIAKEYLDAYNTLVSSQSKFWIWLLLGLGLQVISSLSSLFIQWRLKSLDKNITKFNLREERRIQVAEEVYKQMVVLTRYVPGESVEQLITDISVLNSYISVQQLYIPSEVKAVLDEYLDYFRTVTSKSFFKNISREEELLDKYYKLFNS